jgi:inosine-uridine nucleoside N-ribohydrolase
VDKLYPSVSRAVIFILLSISLQAFAAEPVRLILDTDMGNDCDDALALAMIHALENRNEVRLLAVTITKDNRDAATFIDLVNHFYGRPDVPIGVVRDGKTPKDTPMLKVPVERRDAHGNFVYPRRLHDGSEAPEAVALLTHILNEQPDGSVTIAQIGFSTNLARLVATPAGRELASRKVKALYLMAGNFQKPQPEYNVFTDAPAFRDLMKTWPTQIIFSGFEIGLLITYPMESIDRDFAWTTDHPVVEAYKVYVGKPEDHPNWDSTAVLDAIRPDRGYFDLSPAGNVDLGDKDTTVFTPDANGKCRYLILKPDQVARVRELIVSLVSEPPQKAPVAASSQRVAF